MVYMNTNVTRGSGAFVVTSTGMETEVGHISHMLQATEDADTPLTVQLKKLTNQILVHRRQRGRRSRSCSTCRAARASTPSSRRRSPSRSRRSRQACPRWSRRSSRMGTQMLAKANAIMKRLRSTETLGSTSAINSDKTGTLTLNQMTAVELTIPGRRYTISGGGYSTEGTIKQRRRPAGGALEQFLLPMALCVDAVVKRRRADRRSDRGGARRARREGRPGRGRDAGEVSAPRRAARSTPRTS